VAPDVENTPTQNSVITTKLLSVEGGTYVQSAGYYQGTLQFIDIKNGNPYHLFSCLKKWPVYKIGTYYYLDLNDLKNTSHSAENSGCYTKELLPATL
jgi:hypothetical protein